MKYYERHGQYKKTIIFQQICNEQHKLKIRKFHLQQHKSKKILYQYLAKEVQVLHPEYYNTSLKEIQEASNKSKDIPRSSVRELNIVKTSIFPKLI